MESSGGDIVLRQTGDLLGASNLKVTNSLGAAGIEIENETDDFINITFNTTGGVGNITYTAGGPFELLGASEAIQYVVAGDIRSEVSDIGSYFDGPLSVDSVQPIGRLTIDSANNTLDAETIVSEAFTGADGTLTEFFDNQFVFADSTTQNLEVYEFTGNAFSLVGVAFNYAISGQADITALSRTRIAFGANSGELIAYDWDGTNFTQAGNTLVVSGSAAQVAITAMSENRIAWYDDGNEELRVYEFDGTDWVQVGSGLSVGSMAFGDITTLQGSRILFAENTTDNLVT